MTDYGNDEFHTPEERAADEQERRQIAEIYDLDTQLDDEMAALERLADEDYLGLCFFGDEPGWIEKRLSRNPPK